MSDNIEGFLYNLHRSLGHMSLHAQRLGVSLARGRLLNAHCWDVIGPVQEI